MATKKQGTRDELGKRRNSRRAAVKDRTPRNKKGVEMVRATDVPESKRGIVGSMAAFVACLYARALSALSVHDSLARERFPWWRATLCHFAPILVGIVLGYVLITATGPRAHVREVEKIWIVPHEVRQGAPFEVHVQVTDIRRCDGVVNVVLLDSKGVTYTLGSLPVFASNIAPLGEAFEFVRTFTLPPNISPGITTYFADRHLWCNVFQKYIWPLNDNSSATFYTVASPPVPEK